MNPDTGAVYPSREAALEAGERSTDIVEILGSQRAIKSATKAIQSNARRKAKRKAQRAGRKTGRS